MATHAEQMVTKLEAAMLKHAGKTQVQLDGVMMTFQNMRVEWKQWKKIVAEEAGKRPGAAEINLS